MECGRPCARNGCSLVGEAGRGDIDVNNLPLSYSTLSGRAGSNALPHQQRVVAGARLAKG